MQAKTKKRLKWAAVYFILLLIIGLLAARLYLPIWLKDYVNQQLQTRLTGYTGHVEDIDVALIRGAYMIRGLKITKKNANMPVPFLTINNTDLSLQWGALFKGRIVSDIHLTGATLNFAINRSGTQSQTGKEADWTTAIKKLSPIDINVVTISGSKITYRDFSSEPEVNLFINDVSGELRNLRNVDDRSKALPSPFTFTGTSIGGGKLSTSGNVNALKRITDLDGSLKLEGADLTSINTYSMAYASVDFERGTLDAYAELAIKDGNVRGYLKPIARNIVVIDNRPKDKNVFEKIWEYIAAALIEVFSNQGKDQFATRVEFEGRYDDVNRPFWPMVGGILRNAFVQAFSRRVDEIVSFTDNPDAPLPAETGDKEADIDADPGTSSITKTKDRKTAH